MCVSRFIHAANECFRNGERLLDEARNELEYCEPPATSLFVAIIAQEEFAKSFLLCLVAKDVIPWDPLLRRAINDHKCKHLIAAIMEHMSDFDKCTERHDQRHKDHLKVMQLYDDLKQIQDNNERTAIMEQIDTISEFQGLLPPTIADAIFIFRHEKIGRWAANNWVWDEEPQYDPIAKQLADGKLDSEKQDALYVRLNQNGEVISTPIRRMIGERATQERERANQFRWLVKAMLDGKSDAIDQERIESAFKNAFAGLTSRTT